MKLHGVPRSEKTTTMKRARTFAKVDSCKLWQIVVRLQGVQEKGCVLCDANRLPKKGGLCSSMDGCERGNASFRPKKCHSLTEFKFTSISYGITYSFDIMIYHVILCVPSCVIS